MLSKLKEFTKRHLNDIILLIGVILISLLSFALGYIVAKQQEKEPLRIEHTNREYSRIRARIRISTNNISDICGLFV